MKRFLSLAIALLMALSLLPAAVAEEGAGYGVILPAGYDTDGLNYPVIYLLPQDGYAADDSILCEKLVAAMDAGQGTDMIIVRPAFAMSDDVLAKLNGVIEAVDAAYRTIPDPAHRAVVGTGVGGYLAYVALLNGSPIQAAASVRGDFVSDANPWLAVYGGIQEKMEELHGADENALNAFYTYMDAPVDDAWTNMKGSTNDLGALMIGYGTGSEFHEYTVRPGAFDDAFVAESAGRIVNRLTGRMLSSVASGKVWLEKTTLTADDPTATAHYTVSVSDAINIHAAGEMELDAVVSILDPKTGDVLTSATEKHAITGAGDLEGSVTLDNVVNGSSATVNLAVTLLGTTTDVATATLIRAQEPFVDGDYQQIELLGDWYFKYVGAGDEKNGAALTKDEFETWDVVQPGLAWWTKGFGNISDENVSSRFGPDYFDYFITGGAYYAKTFTVPENFDAKDLVLSVGYVDDRCEAFLNGVKVGATGLDEAGEPTGDTTWAVFSHFEIDPSLLNIGGENVMVVRAWNDLGIGAGGWYAGPVGLYSAVAFEDQYGEGANPRFFEDSFESAHVAAAKEEEGTAEEKYLVYLPEGYFESDRNYPSVYLLHQFNSDHTSYRTDHVDELLDEGIAAGLFDEMIVVIPNSDENSWWRGEWEKMITEELIPLIDSQYRTIPDARFRLTAGCSMGGQGAYAVALRNPDFFSGAISFFGAFSFGGESDPNAIAEAEGADYMKNFTLYFICGNQDSYGFGRPAISLNQKLEAMGVPHKFFIENGGHNSVFYVPFFKDAFSYVRANMYKSDEAVEALLSAGLTVDGAAVKAAFTADEGIAAYLNEIPASSYTIEQHPALVIPLVFEFAQDGEVICAAAVKDVAVQADQLSADISVELPEGIDLSKPTTVTLKAQIFDRVVALATAEIAAK